MIGNFFRRIFVLMLALASVPYAVIYLFVAFCMMIEENKTKYWTQAWAGVCYMFYNLANLLVDPSVRNFNLRIFCC